MIKAVIMWDWGACHGRMYHSMIKSLPDDVELSVIDRYNRLPFKPDIIIGHYGFSNYKPYFAFISPKIVISEILDPITLSYFGKNDALLMYNNTRYNELIEEGYKNIYLWPRPVDPEIFFVEPDIEKDIDFLMPSYHFGYHRDILVKLNELGYKTVVLTLHDDDRHKWSCFHELMTPVGEVDYCYIGSGDDKIRHYFNRSKYTLCPIKALEYFPKYYTHGYEVSNVEAIFCGSIPIIEKCDYKEYWFGEWCKITDFDTYMEYIIDIINKPYIPLITDQITKAVDKFNSVKIWDEFWGIVRTVLEE